MDYIATIIISAFVGLTIVLWSRINHWTNRAVASETLTDQLFQELISADLLNRTQIHRIKQGTLSADIIRQSLRKKAEARLTRVKALRAGETVTLMGVPVKMVDMEADLKRVQKLNEQAAAAVQDAIDATDVLQKDVDYSVVVDKVPFNEIAHKLKATITLTDDGLSKLQQKALAHYISKGLITADEVRDISGQEAR